MRSLAVATETATQAGPTSRRAGGADIYISFVAALGWMCPGCSSRRRPDDDRVVARTHPRRITEPAPLARQRPYCARYPASSWYSPVAPFHPARACAERGFLPSRLALSVNDAAHHYLPPSIPNASTFCDPTFRTTHPAYFFGAGWGCGLGNWIWAIGAERMSSWGLRYKSSWFRCGSGAYSSTGRWWE
ncbi:hypothetical protein C8J57DRAFT_1729809 [Mycena rebaudengoi]|nr:hypothetical protein C8J57DRAFT_1729809 [Mycena rebaudengoi]